MHIESKRMKNIYDKEEFSQISKNLYYQIRYISEQRKLPET